MHPVTSQKGYQGFGGGDPQEEPKDVLAQVRQGRTNRASGTKHTWAGILAVAVLAV